MSIQDVALNAIAGYKLNPVISKFVTDEALESVAKELKAEGYTAVTAKGVQVLGYKYKNIQKRIDDYINLGFIGVFFASI